MSLAAIESCPRFHRKPACAFWVLVGVLGSCNSSAGGLCLRSDILSGDVGSSLRISNGAFLRRLSLTLFLFLLELSVAHVELGPPFSDFLLDFRWTLLLRLTLLQGLS